MKVGQVGDRLEASWTESKVKNAKIQTTRSMRCPIYPYYTCVGVLVDFPAAN
jgi:hypothetical protein